MTIALFVVLALAYHVVPASAQHPTLAGLSVDPAIVTGGYPSRGTVSLSGAAPDGGAAVELTSSTSVVSFPHTVTVPAGATSASFTITTMAVSAALSVTIQAGYAGSTASATLRVTPPASGESLFGLSLNPTTVLGGNRSQGTVTLSGSAPTGGATVALTSSAPAAGLPATVDIPAGTKSATFDITTTAVSSTVTAVITASFAGATKNASLTITAAPPPPPGSSGTLYVAAGSGASDSNPCSQAAPCASFDRAYQLARPGGTVEVSAGTYPWQTVVQSEPSKGAPAVTIRAAAGARVVVEGIQLGVNSGAASGTAPSYLVFDGFDINGQFHASYSGSGSGASNITLKNSHVYQWNAVGPMLLLRDVVNFSAVNVEVGPACCQADAIQLSVRGDGSPNPQNVVFNQLYVHDVADTCRSEPNYPDCAGSGYGDGCGNCEHIDGIQAFGGQGITITNSRFYNAGTQNIFLKSANGGSFSNILVENTMVSTSYGLPTNSVSLDGTASVFSGFVKFRYNTFQKDVRIYQNVLGPGTEVEFTGNIAAYRGDSGGTGPCTFSAGDGSTVNPSYSHNLFGNATCAASDLLGLPTFVSANPATPDLHLQAGSRGVDGGDPADFPATDIDGRSRPQGGAPDIGAAEQ